jgi:flagellar export protein FliJ
MAESSKLAALLKSLELEERSILDEKKQIEEIFEKRKASFETLEKELSGIVEKLDELKSRSRGTALRSGDVLSLGSIDTFRVRLTSQCEEIKPRVAKAKKELETAQIRMENVEDELVAVRIEMKKVEKVIENRLRSERLSKAAAEESEIDEMGFFRRKK